MADGKKKMSATRRRSITTSCNAGEDPLSFLLDSSPAATTSHVDDCCINRAALPLPPAHRDASAAPATCTTGSSDRVAVTETPSPPETPQDRAARLLAMCDERGVGTAKGTPKPPASSTLQEMGTGVDETINNGEREGSGGTSSPRRSLQTSRAFAQLTRSTCNDDDNISSSWGSDAGAVLFNESVTSLKSTLNTNEGNTATDHTAADHTLHIASSISSQIISDGNAIDIDDLLRRNDRLEDETHRLRTLLTKRTTALENEKRALASELSRIRDCHRESQSVVADLMTRMEHLQRSNKDQIEINEALTTENQQLRSENYYLRRRQTDLEVEIESGGDGGGGNTGGSSNTENWLSRWGRGWKVEQTVSSTTFPDGELRGVTDLVRPVCKMPKECSGGCDSDASEDSPRANGDLLLREGKRATSAEERYVRSNKNVVDNKFGGVNSTSDG